MSKDLYRYENYNTIVADVMSGYRAGWDIDRIAQWLDIPWVQVQGIINNERGK